MRAEHQPTSWHTRFAAPDALVSGLRRTLPSKFDLPADPATIGKDPASAHLLGRRRVGSAGLRQRALAPRDVQVELNPVDQIGRRQTTVSLQAQGLSGRTLHDRAVVSGADDPDLAKTGRRTQQD
jgi:hypothetical protein